MYGFCLICSTLRPPYTLKIFTAEVFEIPYSPKNSISALIPAFAFSCSENSTAFFGVIPLSLATLSGSFSITSSAASPNSSTSLFAVEGPIPLIAPEER